MIIARPMPFRSSIHAFGTYAIAALFTRVPARQTEGMDREPGLITRW